MHANQHHKINYIELPSTNISQTKQFYSSVFGWAFTDYGPEYVAFDQAGIDGGFYKSELTSSYSNGAALVVLYSLDLESCIAKVTAAGGQIVREIFEFPGGRRFHFTDTTGNELAVWSDR